MLLFPALGYAYKQYAGKHLYNSDYWGEDGVNKPSNRKEKNETASQVTQWLRTRLPMQGTWV